MIPGRRRGLERHLDGAIAEVLRMAGPYNFTFDNAGGPFDGASFEPLEDVPHWGVRAFEPIKPFFNEVPSLITEEIDEDFSAFHAGIPNFGVSAPDPVSPSWAREGTFTPPFASRPVMDIDNRDLFPINTPEPVAALDLGREYPSWTEKKDPASYDLLSSYGQPERDTPPLLDRFNLMGKSTSLVTTPSDFLPEPPARLSPPLEIPSLSIPGKSRFYLEDEPEQIPYNSLMDSLRPPGTQDSLAKYPSPIDLEKKPVFDLGSSPLAQPPDLRDFRPNPDSFVPPASLVIRTSPSSTKLFSDDNPTPLVRVDANRHGILEKYHLQYGGAHTESLAPERSTGFSIAEDANSILAEILRNTRKPVRFEFEERPCYFSLLKDP